MQARRKGLELVDGVTGLSKIIQSRTAETEALEDDKNKTLNSFEGDTKKAKEFLKEVRLWKIYRYLKVIWIQLRKL